MSFFAGEDSTTILEGRIVFIVYRVLTNVCRGVCMSSSSYFTWAVKWWNSYIWGRRNITTFIFRFTWEFFNSLCYYPVMYLVIFHGFFFYWEFLRLTGCINTIFCMLQGSMICKVVLFIVKKFVRYGICSFNNVYIFLSFKTQVCWMDLNISYNALLFKMSKN